MDVRTNLVPSPAQGTAADVNKNQDGKDKHHPRTLRKREPDGIKSNAHPKSYNIQKKDFVKGQKSKRQYHGGAEENSKVVVRKLPERGSVLVPKHKKENGNYLLNFRYERDKVGDAGGLSRDTGRYNRKNNRLLPPVQQHKYNKEQFVQSSCQFVVSACGDYSLHLTNPDILVDWKLIEQIRFYSSGNLSCPICLYAPVAGKITRCGHIYCWPCILRYLCINDDNDSCRCPICYQYVHKNDLKSVIVITRSTFALGDTINLRLMRREKNSLFATPVEPTIHSPTTFLSVSENADNEIYSKLLIANVKDIVDIIEHERFELEDELQKNPEMFDYIEQALGELSKRKEQWKLAENKDTVPVESVTEIVEETLQNNEKNVNEDLKNDDTKFLPKQSSTDSASSDTQFSSSPSKFSYFYQVEDGQHMYLHAVNVKMLEMQYSNLKNCPSIITGKLLEKEASICTEDLRRRLRYLCHLPLNSPFELAEIELKPPLVSVEVVQIFHEQLNSRRKRREQKKREEKKREVKITEEENKLIGIYPTPNIDIESYQEFPEWQPEQLYKDYISSSPESASSVTVDSPPAHSSVSNFEAISSNTALSTLDEITLKREMDCPQEQGLTFAAILTGTRNKSVDPWPSVKSKKYSNPVSTSSKNEETPPTARRTYNKSAAAWPSVKSLDNSGTTSASSNEDEKEAYVQKSEFPDAEQNKSPEPETRDDGNAGGKKKKKKKGKRVVLFKTGMTSGYSL